MMPQRMLAGAAGAAGGGGAIAFVQSAVGTHSGDNTDTTISFSAATANNLLVAALTCMGGPLSTINVPSGWTAATSLVSASQGDDPEKIIQRMFYKVAAGGETSLTVTTADSLRMGVLHFFEFSGNKTSAVLDVVATNSDSGGDNQVSTGTTAATAQPAEVAVAQCNLGGLDSTGATWSQGFTADDWTEIDAPGGAGDGAVASAYKILSATGAQETTATFTDGATNQIGTGSIATFKAE